MSCPQMVPIRVDRCFLGSGLEKCAFLELFATVSYHSRVKSATKGFIVQLFLNLSTRLTTTAAANATANTVGPHLSSNPPCPLIRILFARQWYVKSAYAIVAIATMVKRTADVRPMLSPKLRSPTASPPRRTVKLSHERKVRSLAKKTFGSTRVGRAMRFPAKVHKRHPLHTGSA